MSTLNLFVAVLTVIAAFYYWKKPAHLPLPPGPARYPLLGSILSVPKTSEWVVYHQWSTLYGSDIIHLDVLGQHLIILDSLKAANELLDKRSSIYSSRPHSTLLSDIMGKKVYTEATLGNKWRQCRRLAHSFFGPQTSENYRPNIIQAVHNLLARLLRNPKDIQTELVHTTGDAIMLTCYGLDVWTPEGARNLEIVEKGTTVLADALAPGRYLVESFPILKHVPHWMPGAGFQKKARRNAAILNDMINLPFAAARREFEKGLCSHCFVCLTSQDAEAEQRRLNLEHDDMVRDVAGTMYQSGLDTTSSALGSCILGLLSRPEVIKRGRAELDSVIKPECLPAFEDQPHLPFITAIVKETLRWKPVTPLGVPHYLEKDDEYNGYRIPAGSIVLTNQWAILHDEDVYPEPFVFKPERFMAGNQFNFEIMDPEMACWGFGRRICVGRYMAFASIWITIASLLYVFEIEKEVDAQGNEVEPDPPYTSGFISGPTSFSCRIRPRSEEHANLVRSKVSTYGDHVHRL